MWVSKLTIHVLLPGGSGATWGRRRGTTANGPREVPESSERTGRGMGHQCREATVSKSGWTALSETEDGRRRKTLEEALASERGQSQRLWESLCVGMLVAGGVGGLKHVTYRRINTGRVD